MSDALKYCLKLMATGWEWPDASAKAAVKFRVDIDELTEEFDQQQERGNEQA